MLDTHRDVQVKERRHRIYCEGKFIGWSATVEDYKRIFGITDDDLRRARDMISQSNRVRNL